MNSPPGDDERFMRLALQEASEAGKEGEVPVGAVFVLDRREVSRGRNRTIADADPSAHAEIVALRRAGALAGDHRLGGTLYVTLEPCVMCMGALVQARIERLVFGALDPKAGAAVSLYEIGADRRLNHRFPVEGGVLAEEAGPMLSGFFRQRR
ncbi:MAG TPA: tRNA adenosine(34) deaminase TadA [Candidatus Binatia bacterium]|nr:tRNA adenosine(34) deaminase TadA [Candidatus Binatia bacterium]